MDAKTLQTLEYPKVLERLANYASFSASAELCRALHPTHNLAQAQDWLTQTDEARLLLDQRPETSIGGAHDVRQQAEAAARGSVLTVHDFLDIKSTLISARELFRLFDRLQESFPALADVALRMPPPLGLIDTITGIISDRGDVHDNATQKLARIRRDLRIAHERLLSKMQRYLSDPEIAPLLQDNLITQRDGRYVIPLRADFKGRLKSIIHDQSSSGATLFVEPLAVVQNNNEYRELQLAERDEVRRILAELSESIGERAIDLEIMVETIAELDLIFSKAKYADATHCGSPALKDFRIDAPFPHPGSGFFVEAARHPLLDPETVVPIDIVIDPETYALIITGPNTGGKTVSLKTVGLLVLMAQSGLHIPAKEGAELTVYRNVYADIGDEQSIEQSLSTFSGHITNIVRILNEADHQSLVIFDELGSGTDPQEGAALAMAILVHLLERGITTFVATHYPELKTFALSRTGIVNASVEFDIRTLAPTFNLLIGVPGRSNALSIAERLGLPKEIVDSAREGIPQHELRADDLLEDLHQQRERTRAAMEEAEFTESLAEKRYTDLKKRLRGIEDERREILEQARKEAAERIEVVDKEMQDLRRMLDRARQPLEVIQEVQEKIAEMEDEVAEPIVRKQTVPVERKEIKYRSFRLGDKVQLRDLGSQGVVSALTDDGQAEVQIGTLRVRTSLDKIQLFGELDQEPEPRPDPAPRKSSSSPSSAASPGIELDLRGNRVEDAMEALERYLDSAYLAALPWVRIIHGKGTGRLREAVRELLQKHPQIKSVEAGKQGEGGDGVTVARLKT